MSECSVCKTVDFNNCESIEDLLRFVMPYVPQVPHSMGLDLLRQAYIRFAKSSGILVAELTQDIQKDVKDYLVECPKGYEIYYFVGRDGERLYSPVDTWTTLTSESGRRFDARFDAVDNNILVLWDNPSSDEENGLKIYAALLPNSCVDCIPKSIMTPFGWGIAQQALANLYFMPNKPWASAGLGRRSEIEFNRTVASARHLADTNRKRGPLMAKPVRVL